MTGYQERTARRDCYNHNLLKGKRTAIAAIVTKKSSRQGGGMLYVGYDFKRKTGKAQSGVFG
jgi:hypothetical protein